MKKKVVLTLDQGTTSSRAILFDENGNVLGKSAREFRQIYPQAGWVEHDPFDILGSQMGVIGEATAKAGLTVDDIAAIGITNQRETTVIWDAETGKPVCNAIVWQCRRTAETAERLKKEGYEQLLYDKTGLIPDAYFSATKIAWIFDHVDGAREKAEAGKLKFGTIDTFLLWHLSGGKVHATDYTNASRTMLFNIHTLDWDDDLLEIFGVPRQILPEVHPSGYEYGVASANILGREVPVCALVGDQQAALFGQLCTEKGDVKNTYGTGCFLLMNAGKDAPNSKRGLLTTLAAGLGKPNYALEGSVFVGGAAVQWLRDELRMIKSSADTETYARRVPDTGGVYVVPAFVGLGAPHWDSRARGLISGLTRGTTKEHFIRAVLEGIAYQVNDVLHAMARDTGLEPTALKVDGGASANNFLMQFQADISNCAVVRPKCVESTALGAGYLAGLTCGYYESIAAIRKNVRVDCTFTPDMSADKRERLLEGWGDAILRAKAR